MATDIKAVHDKITEIVPAQYLMFLDPKEGISSTQANSIAEKVKELVKIQNSEILQTGSAVETLYHDNGREIVISNPRPIDFQAIALKTGELYGITALLREAIKAKDAAVAFVNNTAVVTLIPEPVYAEEVQPDKEGSSRQTFSAEEAACELGLNEYTNFLLLQAKASEYGKLLHGNGIMSQIKKDLGNFASTRFECKQSGTGPKDYPVTRTPVYKNVEYNSTFIDVMNLHREAENKLNWYKAKMQNILSDKNAQYERDFQREYQDATHEYQNLYAVYAEVVKGNQNLRKLWISKATEMRMQVKTVLSTYKIVIPASLKAIYDYVDNF